MAERNELIRRQVILADGTVMSGDAGAVGDSVLWIWIRDAGDPCCGIAELSRALAAPGALDSVTVLDGGESTVYTGYARVTAVKNYQGELVCARLEKEAADV